MPKPQSSLEQFLSSAQSSDELESTSGSGFTLDSLKARKKLAQLPN